MSTVTLAGFWLAGILGLQLVSDRTNPLLLLAGWVVAGCLATQALDICHFFVPDSHQSAIDERHLDDQTPRLRVSGT